MASHQDSMDSGQDIQLVDPKLEKLRELNIRYSQQEEKLGSLTVKRAFLRWVIFMKPRFGKELLGLMFKNCRITPSKAISALFSKSRLSKEELETIKTRNRLEIGLAIIASMVKKITYKNQHHYFFQGRLLFIKLPFVYSLVKHFKSKTLFAFKKLRENLRNMKVEEIGQTFVRMRARQRNPLVDAFWRIRMEAVTKRKTKVQFKIDSLENLSLNSSQVVLL